MSAGLFQKVNNELQQTTDSRQQAALHQIQEPNNVIGAGADADADAESVAAIEKPRSVVCIRLRKRQFWGQLAVLEYLIRTEA